MLYMNPCTTLWNQQATLFEQVHQLRLLIAHTERQANHHQQILDKEGCKRNERRKAKWTVSTNRRYLEDLESRSRTLLHTLATCQNQIAQIQQEAPWSFAQPQLVYESDWLQSHDISMEFSPGNQSFSTDYSFAERSFDDPSPGSISTAEPTSDVYPHELMTPIERPVITRPHFTSSTGSTASLIATANEFVPSPIEATIYSPQTSKLQINSRLVFTQPLWTINSASWYGCGDTAVTFVPVSPLTGGEGGDGKEVGTVEPVKRRYSIAAIELIESRLRKKSEERKSVLEEKVIQDKIPEENKALEARENREESLAETKTVD